MAAFLQQHGRSVIVVTLILLAVCCLSSLSCVCAHFRFSSFCSLVASQSTRRESVYCLRHKSRRACGWWFESCIIAGVDGSFSLQMPATLSVIVATLVSSRGMFVCGVLFASSIVRFETQPMLTEGQHNTEFCVLFAPQVTKHLRFVVRSV